MADNITLNSGSGGAIIRTDDDGTNHWQYVKIAYGADNTQTIVGSTASNPFPVALSDVDNAVLDNIQTAVQLIDNAISGAGFNITQLGGASVPLGAGVEATAVRVTLATDSTGVVSIDDNGGSLTVDGTVATTNGGTFAVQESGAALTALQLIDNAVSGAGFNITQFAGAAVPIGAGVEATAVRVTLATDSTGVVSVDDNGGSITVDGTVATTNAGTFAVQVDGSALTALQLIDNPIVAHDAAASGASGVNMSGAYATNSVETITQVANADAARILADLNGCIITRPHTTLEEIIVEQVSNTDGASTAFTNFSAGGAGIHNYITTLAIWNSSATNGYVDIRDGTAGAVLFTAPAPTVGGSVINLPVPLKQTTANTALAFDVSAALTTVYISAVGFQAQG